MTQTTGRRPKLKDICARAGLSRATVDRVINNRGGVRAHTRQHVLSVIDELSNGGAFSGGNPAAETLTIDLIIPDRGNAFLAEQAMELAAYAEQIGTVAIALHRPGAATEGEFLAALRAIVDTTRAIGVVGVDSHRVREALRALCRRNIPVVTLASDIRNIPRTAYVGIDNHAAGRLAGYLTGRLIRRTAGKAALILGSRAYRGHEEREMGFRSILREMFPSLRIVNELEVQEDARQAHGATRALLSENEDLDGIYCIGAGQAGVAQALVEAGRETSVLFVGHGLSADTRTHLEDGVMDVVIHEDVKYEARAAIDILLAASRGRTGFSSPVVPIQAIFCENLPPQT